MAFQKISVISLPITVATMTLAVQQVRRTSTHSTQPDHSRAHVRREEVEEDAVEDDLILDLLHSGALGHHGCDDARGGAALQAGQVPEQHEGTFKCSNNQNIRKFQNKHN